MCVCVCVKFVLVKYNFEAAPAVLVILLKHQLYFRLLKMSSSPLHRLPGCTGWGQVWYKFGEYYGTTKTEWKFNNLRSLMTPEEISLIDAKYREVEVKLSLQQTGADQLMVEMSKIETEIKALELIVADRLR